MPLLLLASAAVFVVAFFVSSARVRRALGALTPDERTAFVDRVVATRSPWGLVAYLGLLGLWLGATWAWPAHARLVHGALLASIVVLMGVFVARGHRRTEGFPDAFRRGMLQASLARVVGVLALAGAMAWPLLSGPV